MKLTMNFDVPLPDLKFPDGDANVVEYVGYYLVGTSRRVVSRSFDYSHVVEICTDYEIRHRIKCSILRIHINCVQL